MLSTLIKLGKAIKTVQTGVEIGNTVGDAMNCAAHLKASKARYDNAEEIALRDEDEPDECEQ